MKIIDIISNNLLDTNLNYFNIEYDFVQNTYLFYEKYLNPTSDDLKKLYPFTNYLTLDDLYRETYPQEFFISDEKLISLKTEIMLYFPENMEEENNGDKLVINVPNKYQTQPTKIYFYKSDKIIKKKYEIKNNQFIFQNPLSLKDLLYMAVDLSRFPFLSPPVINTIDNLEIEINNLTFTQKRNIFQRIILGRRPSEGLRLLDSCNILDFFLPELTQGKNLSQNRFHAYDIFEHSLRALDGVNKADPHIRWAALLHDIGKTPTRNVLDTGEATFHNHEMFSAKMVPVIMNRLGIPKNIGQRIQFLVRNHMFHYTREWSDKAVRRFIKKIDKKDLEDLIALRLADRKGSGKKTEFPRGLQLLINHIDTINQYDSQFKISDLNINGNDLISLGFKEGPTIGVMLNDLLNLVLNNNLPNTFESLKEKVLEYKE